MLKQFVVIVMLFISFNSILGMDMPLGVFAPTPEKIQALKRDLIPLEKAPKEKELKSNDFHYILKVQSKNGIEYYQMRSKQDIKLAKKKAIKKNESVWYKLNAAHYDIVLSKIVAE